LLGFEPRMLDSKSRVITNFTTRDFFFLGGTFTVVHDEHMACNKETFLLSPPFHFFLYEARSTMFGQSWLNEYDEYVHITLAFFSVVVFLNECLFGGNVV
jgi:hypothetical protein